MNYPKLRSQGIIEMAVTDPMPRKKSGEDLKRENMDLREEDEYLKDKVAYLEALYIILMKEKAEQNQKRDLKQFSQRSIRREGRT